MRSLDRSRPPASARYAAYALIGAALGGITVWFVADTYSVATFGSGIAGGAIAGVIAGFVRAKAGLDT